MRLILGFGGMCGFIMCVWGVADFLSPSSHSPAEFPKFWGGLVLMMLADGFEALITIAKDMRERHPGEEEPEPERRSWFGRKSRD